MQREPLPQYATDDQIETLVATFYARIRRDEVLGPIFLTAIGEDWTAHLKTMCDFWSSVRMHWRSTVGRARLATLMSGSTPRLTTRRASCVRWRTCLF